MKEVIPASPFKQKSPILLICSFFIFQSLTSFGQDDDPYNLDSVQCYINEIYTAEPDSAFFLIENNIASILSEKHLSREDSIFLAIMYNTKGELCHYTSPKLALNSYFKAQKIFLFLGYKKGLTISYLNLSAISTDQEQKIGLSIEAKQLAEYINDTFLIITALNALGNAMKSESMDMTDSILSCYEKGLDLAFKIKDSASIAMIYNNMGTIASEQEQTQEAIDYYYKSLTIANKNNHEHFLICQTNLMVAYLNANHLDSALHYYELIKPEFERRPEFELTYYNSFSNYYKNKGDKAKAFDYHIKADSVKDFLDKDNNASALNLLELEYQSQIQKERMAHLNAQIKKSEYIRYLLISIVFIILSSGSIIFYQFKQRARKRREALLHKRRMAEAEKRLVEEKLQKEELHSKYLSNELAYVATGSVQNRELLSELKQRVDLTYRKKDMGSIKDNLKDLSMQLTQLIRKDQDEQQKVIEKAKEVNMSLIYGLKEKFPDLSDSDTKLLMLLLLKFNSKEIATMYNIEEQSAVRRRYRLRKKLGMKRREPFEDFFNRVLPDIELLGRKGGKGFEC